MRRFVPALLLLAAAAVSRPQDSSLRLWAVGDGVRISPLTGKLLENRPDIHRDYPSGAPRAGNAVRSKNPGHLVRFVRAVRARGGASPKVLRNHRGHLEGRA